MELNKQQKNAVNHLNGPAVIIAGAGTGKTRVLTERIKNLIQNVGINHYRILGLTFTNKAASEIVKRISEWLKIKPPYMKTFHSFGLMFLREEINVLGYSSNFVILDETDKKDLIKELMRKRKIPLNYKLVKKIHKIISFWKRKMQSIEECLFEFINHDIFLSSDDELIIKTVIDDYQYRLKQENLLDFDDLLLLPLQILVNYPKIRENWSSKFDYILVDEFQDTSDIQYELLKNLTLKNKNIFVVGDPNQAIYSWRGSCDKIMEIFQKEYGATLYILTNNYRSRQYILDASNNLIKYNKPKNLKKLKATIRLNGTIKLALATTTKDESAWIVEKIKELLNQENECNEIAILYRSSYYSRTIEEFLIKAKLPYMIVAGVRFYERKEIKDVLAFLRILTNKDLFSLKRLLKKIADGIGDVSIDRIENFANENKINVYDLLNQIHLVPNMGKDKQEICKNFWKMFEEWKKINFENISDLIDQILIETKYYDRFFDQNNVYDMNDNINELKAKIIEYQKQYPLNTLNEYLQDIQIYSEVDNVADHIKIKLMTIHAAKGLEFDNVFLMGLTSGVLPDKKSISIFDESMFQEERRICYVGLTRAKHRLFISASTFGSWFGIRRPSIFLKEMNYEEFDTDDFENSLQKWGLS